MQCAIGARNFANVAPLIIAALCCHRFGLAEFQLPVAHTVDEVRVASRQLREACIVSLQSSALRLCLLDRFIETSSACDDALDHFGRAVGDDLSRGLNAPH